MNLEKKNGRALIKELNKYQVGRASLAVARDLIKNWGKDSMNGSNFCYWKPEVLATWFINPIQKSLKKRTKK